MAVYLTRMGDMRNAYNILLGNPQGRRTLGRTRHRWKDSIQMELKETEYEGADWIELA